jgi:hypothetical protein
VDDAILILDEADEFDLIDEAFLRLYLWTLDRNLMIDALLWDLL